MNEGNSGSREKEINQVIANDREKSNEIEDFLLLVLENETFSLISSKSKGFIQLSASFRSFLHGSQGA